MFWRVGSTRQEMKYLSLPGAVVVSLQGSHVRCYEVCFVSHTGAHQRPSEWCQTDTAPENRSCRSHYFTRWTGYWAGCDLLYAVYWRGCRHLMSFHCAERLTKGKNISSLMIANIRTICSSCFFVCLSAHVIFIHVKGSQQYWFRVFVHSLHVSFAYWWWRFLGMFYVHVKFQRMLL